VSVDSEGNQENLKSSTPSISADGRYVAFESFATNLVPEDTCSNNCSNEIYAYGPLIQETVDVSIDIAPRRDPNRINPEHGRLNIAIITDDSIDVNQVNPETIRFGPAQAESISERITDIDQDGDTDLILQFSTAETGIACGDTEATLVGETWDSVSIRR
jgi:hypothetical protein